MNEIIAALQDEIEAAQKKRNPLSEEYWYGYLNEDGREELARLGGYIQGLNRALALLEKEPTT